MNDCCKKCKDMNGYDACLNHSCTCHEDSDMNNPPISPTKDSSWETEFVKGNGQHDHVGAEKDAIEFIRSLLASYKAELAREVEERIMILTNGSGKTQKELGDIYADTEHAQVRELRQVLALINKK